MTDQILVSWIDDDMRHIVDAKFAMSQNNNLLIDFKHPLDFKPDFKADLYLLDDRLFQTNRDDGKKFEGRGVTLALDIRLNFLEQPIYIFSNEKVDEGVFGFYSQVTHGIADEILFYKDIQRNGANILYSDAIDYRKLNALKREDVEALLSVFSINKETKDEIYIALPAMFKNGLSLGASEKSEGNAVSYAKWIKNTLLRFPGFLYDSLYSATAVGMTQQTFISKTEFNPACYCDIFSKAREQLWWKHKLLSIFYSLVDERIPKEEQEDPRTYAEKIFHLSANEIPNCEVCGEKYPDTVAHYVKDQTIRKPVHFYCSKIDDSAENLLFFDEHRIFDYEED